MSSYQAYFSKHDPKKILLPSWGHGPFPDASVKRLLRLNLKDVIQMESGTQSKDSNVKNIVVYHSIDLYYEKDSKDLHINSFYIGEDIKAKEFQQADSKIEEVFEYADDTFGSDFTLDLVKRLTEKF